MKETPAQRLKRSREAAGFTSAAAFAEFAGLVDSTYRSHENGTRPLTVPFAKRYAKHLDKDIAWQWLMFGDDFQKDSDPANTTLKDSDSQRSSMLTIDELDVRGIGGSDGAVHEGESLSYDHESIVSQWKIPSSVIRVYTTTPQSRLKIITIVGDSMAPIFLPGERVMVDLDDRLPSPPGIFAIWDGFGQVIKRLEMVPYSEPALVLLKSANKDYETRELPLNDVIVNGRVVGKWLWT